MNRQTGAGILVKVNGNVVGFATSITYQRTLGVKPLYGIDSPFIQEIAITGPFQVTGSLAGFRLRDSGGLDGLSIMSASTPDSYFNQKYASLDIIDRLSGKSMGTIAQAVFVADSWSIDARSPITFSASFIGVFMTQEEIQS